MSKTLAEYEITERKLATKLFEKFPTIQSYSFSQGRVAFDTIFITGEGIKVIGEIKVRNFSVNKYSDYILQVDKVQGIYKRALLNNCKRIYYINFFKNPERPDVIEFIVFNLTPRIAVWKINRPVVEKRMMNAQTCDPTSGKMIKDVIMIKYNHETDMRGSFSLQPKLF